MIDTATIAARIEATPALLRLALSSRDARQRGRAALTIASIVEAELQEPSTYCTDDRQLALPLA